MLTYGFSAVGPVSTRGGIPYQLSEKSQLAGLIQGTEGLVRAQHDSGYLRERRLSKASL